MSLRQIPSSSALVLALSVTASLSGCAIDPGSSASSCSNGTRGEKGKARFTYVGCRAVDNFYLAAGGGKSSIDVQDVTFSSVKAADPSIVTLSYKGTGGSIDVTAGAIGTTELSLLDVGGAEVDRVALIVKGTTKIDYDRGWGQSAGPTVVGGTRQELHVTTVNGMDILVGSGAVKFSATGTVKLDKLDGNGDSAAFIASTGTGTVVADALGGGHAEITVTAIDPAKVDGIDVAPAKQDVERDKQGFVVITFKAGDLPVYGGGCDWTFTGPGTIKTDLFGGSSLSNAPPTIYVFGTKTPGTYAGTCTVLGNKMLSTQLTFK